MACGILRSQFVGIKTVTPVVEVQNPNHWIPREVPGINLFDANFVTYQLCDWTIYFHLSRCQFPHHYSGGNHLTGKLWGLNRKTHVTCVNPMCYKGLTFCLKWKKKINLLTNKETFNVFPSLPILTQFWTSRLEVRILMFTISIFVWKHRWGRNRLTAVKLRKGLILFFVHHAACGTLVPQSGIKPTSLAVGARSLNPWPGSPLLPQERFKLSDLLTWAEGNRVGIPCASLWGAGSL